MKADRTLSLEEVCRLRGERRSLADKIGRLRVHGAEWRRLQARQAGLTRRLLEFELGGDDAGPQTPRQEGEGPELKWWQK